MTQSGPPTVPSGLTFPSAPKVSFVAPIRRFVLLTSTLVGVILLSCALSTSLSFSSPRTPPTQSPSEATGLKPPLQLATYRVGNTGGVGVYIRRTPRLVDQIRAWGDGALMEQVGADLQAEDIIWHQVKDPDGNVGWIPASYLLEITDR